MEEIRLPVSYGSIAGYTAKTGQVVNVADPSQSKELEPYPNMTFDDTWDKKSGFKTRAIISVPLRYIETGLQGVIQLVNSTNDWKFNKADEKLLKLVGNAVAVALFNQNRIKKKG